MQVSKHTIFLLALGAIICSSQANATDLPSTTWLTQVFNWKLPKANFQDATKYLNRGIKLLEQGDYQRAIALLTKAIQINPELVAAYYNRAIARHYLQDYQRAIADFTKVIEINPNDVKAYNERGYARLGLKDNQGAIADFIQAIEINPQLDIAYYNRAVARRQLKDWKAAITDFTHAYSNRDMARALSADKQGAIKDLQKVAQLYQKQKTSPENIYMVSNLHKNLTP